MKNLILIGGGGHCKSCIDVIEQTEKYRIIGILDKELQIGTQILGHPVIGTDERIEEFASQGFEFLITVGQIKSALLRKKLFERVKSANGKLAVVLSPHAYVSKHATLGVGTIVLHHATVNAASTIGENCIVNTNANVEHDCIIGKHVHISTHAVLNGSCTIEDECFIGSNAVTVQGITISKGTIIGAGSLVNQSIKQPGIYVGNPINRIK